MVAELIKRKFGVEFTPQWMGKLLARLGLSRKSLWSARAASPWGARHRHESTDERHTVDQLHRASRGRRSLAGNDLRWDATLSTGAGQRLMLGVCQVAPVRMSISFRKQLPWEPTAKV
jgi:hypothetical protein